MSISPQLESFLGQAHIDYKVVKHSFTDNAYDSACSAHLPISNVVKAVMLRQRSKLDYVIAIIPASNKLKIPWINKELSMDLVLADEIDLAAQFPDCTLGAVPGLAQAYDMTLIWDDQLAEQRDLYFEAGNHQELIHIAKQPFIALFQQHPHSVISLPTECYSLYHSDEIRGGIN